MRSLFLLLRSRRPGHVLPLSLEKGDLTARLHSCRHGVRYTKAEVEQMSTGYKRLKSAMAEAAGNFDHTTIGWAAVVSWCRLSHSNSDWLNDIAKYRRYAKFVHDEVCLSSRLCPPLSIYLYPLPVLLCTGSSDLCRYLAHRTHSEAGEVGCRTSGTPHKAG